MPTTFGRGSHFSPINNTTTDVVERDIEQLYDLMRPQTTEYERADRFKEWIIEQLRAIETDTLSDQQFDAFNDVIDENAGSKFLQDCIGEYFDRKEKEGRPRTRGGRGARRVCNILTTAFSRV